ncbi:MAG: response regulator, partial [Pseudomonadota bacterium]|nr:response regulator [Pseudomonadota bacterium]
LLPAAAADARQPATPAVALAAQDPRNGLAGARVLLVEDNDELAEVTLALLQTYGCGIVRSRNGEDALVLARDAAQPFDVVLSDIVMPGALDGLQLARALRDRMPGLPVVLISGYSRALASAQDFEVLQKPCAPGDLVAALRRAMTTRPASQGEDSIG